MKHSVVADLGDLEVDQRRIGVKLSRWAASVPPKITPRPRLPHRDPGTWGVGPVPDEACSHGGRLRTCEWPACVSARASLFQRARRDS